MEPLVASNARGAVIYDEALSIVVGENNPDLEAAERHAPNAFVLDLSLDDGSSLPLISRLRERLPHAGIVVFTGYKSPALNEQCVRAGANAVVVKTGEIDELTEALRRAVRESRGASDT